MLFFAGYLFYTMNSKLELGLSHEHLLIIVPGFLYCTIAIATKRQHDLGEAMEIKIEFVLMPIVDSIRSTVEWYRLATEPGGTEENKYGEPPKY